LFGRQGIELLNTLRASSAELAALEQRQRELGNTFTPEQLAGVERMNDMWADMQDVMTGIVRTLAADLAPVMEAVMVVMIDSLKEGSTLGGDVRFALEAIPPVIAFAADQTSAFVGTMQMLGVASQAAVTTILTGMAAIDRGHAKLNPFAEETEWLQTWADSFANDTSDRFNEAFGRISNGLHGTIGQEVKRIREEIAAAARERDAAGGTNVDAEKAAIEAAEKLRGEIDGLNESLQFQIDTFGMSADEIARYKLELAGAGEEERAAYGRKQEELQGLKDVEKARQDAIKEQKQQADEAAQKEAAAQKQIIDEGQALANSLRTAEEQRADQIARATELRDAGAISEEIYQRALAKTNNETKRQIDLSREVKGAMAGSVEEALKLDELARGLALGAKAAAGGGAAAGAASPLPAPVDIDAIREQLDRNLDRGSTAGPAPVDIDAIREQLDRNLDRGSTSSTAAGPATEFDAAQREFADRIAAMAEAQGDRPPQSAPTLQIDVDASIAEFVEGIARMNEALNPPSAAPARTAGGTPPPDLSQPTVLTEATAVDRLAELLARTNDLLGAVAQNTSPDVDRDPIANEPITINEVR
jgi:hypothetical protein